MYGVKTLICMQILRRDIHLPELMNVDVTDLADYPPKLLIYMQQVSANCSIPKVQVLGLDRECSFELAHSGILIYVRSMCAQEKQSFPPPV